MSDVELSHDNEVWEKYLQNIKVAWLSHSVAKQPSNEFFDLLQTLRTKYLKLARFSSFSLKTSQKVLCSVTLVKP